MTLRPGSDTLATAETIVQRPAAGRPRGEPIPERIARYELQGLLGEGSMGRVYRAWDPVLRCPVAVKALRPSLAMDGPALERFRREAETLSSFFHPALVTVYEVGPSYLALELVQGVSLERLLRHGRAIEPAVALSILSWIAAGLDHVHQRGVVHRDVKPSNVLVMDGDRAKITDFGIAHVAAAPMTRTGELLGSPAYMAPEQIVQGRVSPASDLHALGAVAYEMLTGVRAFAERNIGKLLQQIVLQEPPPASSVSRQPLPADVDRILARALAKDPRVRFRSGRTFVDELVRGLAPVQRPKR